MVRQFTKDALGWGFVLWLIGYVLGILFFAFVPSNLIGWVIMPIGIAVTLWILLKAHYRHSAPLGCERATSPIFSSGQNVP